MQMSGEAGDSALQGTHWSTFQKTLIPILMTKIKKKISEYSLLIPNNPMKESQISNA